MASLAPGERAKMYAIGGLGRGGATRGGYVSGAACILVDGVRVGFGRPNPLVGVIIKSLSITDQLDEAPNTCRFRVHGAIPDKFAPVVITLGSYNAGARLFAGLILTVNQRYAADNPAFVQADCAAVDHTWQLGFRKVTAQYRNMSAAAIAAALVATAAADGFTADGVAANLPDVNEITFTNEDLPDALTRLARRIGAYWYVDYYKRVHLFFTEVGNGAPEALTPVHRSFRKFTKTGESTQALTRVYVEGRGSRILANVGAGDTLIPLEAVDMFEAAADVFLKVSFQGAEGGAQHLNFAGVEAGGGGTLVGPGVTPTGAPGLALADGGAIEPGAHSYAYTWVTASGETKPSPIAAVTATGGSSVPNPDGAPLANVYNRLDSFLTVGAQYRYVVVFSFPDGRHTLASPASNVAIPLVSNPPYKDYVRVTFTQPGVYYPGMTTASVYRSVNGGPFKYTGFNSNDPYQGYFDDWANSDAAIAGMPEPPATNTATVPGKQTVNLSGIAVGPAGVTARKIYRTAAGGSQLKLLATIANNTATTYTDAAADASLGANVPAADTSGLTQPAGQVNPGSTSIVVASGGAFLAGGGWAVIGNGEQGIRYTGISGNALVGIPASGPGAITAAVVYNSTITAAPMVSGIPASGARAIARALTPGDELYLVVQRDDTARQSSLSAEIGGAGIREEWVTDRRLSIAEARARGDATLAARPLEAASVAYQCRDLRSSSGKDIVVDLPAPTNVHGTFKIQAVTIDNFRPHLTQYPTLTIKAAAARFSFEEWLRLIKTRD